jgi:nicotinamidase-related amidase
MKTLIIIDAQNEFSKNGKRPVPNHAQIIQVIGKKVERAREQGAGIAWVKHYNKPEESKAFVAGTWGAELVPGFGPQDRNGREAEFHKEVYGAFTGSDIGSWLRAIQADELEIVGFYTHGCVSTTAREAIMAGYPVMIDINGTGACDMQHEVLGLQTAEEVRRTALLQLSNMGVTVFSDPLTPCSKSTS